LLVVHLLLLHLVVLGLEPIAHLVHWLLLHSHVRLKSLLVKAGLATELLLLGLLLIHVNLGLEALHGLLLLHASKALVHHVLLSHRLLHGLE